MPAGSTVNRCVPSTDGVIVPVHRADHRSPVTPSGAATCSSTTVPPGRSSTTRSGTWTSPLAPIGNQRIGSPSRSSST